MPTRQILIIEDEIPAAKRLQQLIAKAEPEWITIDVIDSIDDAVLWLKSKPKPDLIFMDIQLADGFSFEIFEQIQVESPVIFATAFNEYAIKAFQVNGLDYLLKPIEEAELYRAIEKFKKQYDTSLAQKDPDNLALDYSQLALLLKNVNTPVYKERFLIKIGEQMKFVKVEDIAYFLSEDGYVFIITHRNDRFLIDDSLEQISAKLKPTLFFKINRKLILNINAIDKISVYFNSRLKLQLKPITKDEVIVSRERVKGFKGWLDG